MPAIKFEEKSRAKGLHALILQGDVYCLPDKVFVVPKSSLDYLDKAKNSLQFGRKKGRWLSLEENGGSATRQSIKLRFYCLCFTTMVLQ